MDPKKKYKSHVTLSQGLMRSYAVKNDGDSVFYLDIETGAIKSEKIKNLDAEPLYYEPIMEKFLSDYVENDFFCLVDRLRKWRKTKKSGLEKIVTIEALESVRKFFKYALLRNKSMYEEVQNNSAFARHVKGFSHGVMLSFAERIDDFFTGKHICILFNNTPSGFVCPHSIIYYAYALKSQRYMLVITASKDLAFCLDLAAADNKVDIIDVMDVKSVEALNVASFIVEKRNAKPYIVGKESDLTILAKNIADLMPVINKDNWPVILNV